MKTLLILIGLSMTAVAGSFTWDNPPRPDNPSELQKYDMVTMYRVSIDEEGEKSYEKIAETETPEDKKIEAEVHVGDILVLRGYTKAGGSSELSEELVIEPQPDSPKNLRLIIEISTNLKDWEEVEIDPKTMFMTARIEEIK